MAIFIRDLILEDTEIITEATADGRKNLYINGIFMQADKKNRNGRIYPKGILEEAVNVFSNDFVKRNRALGELNHPCFDSSANVFVEGKGLIPISEVKVGDYVYGADGNNNTKPVKVLETTKNHFTGNLIEFNSRSFKATVTPYHRFYLKNRNGSFDVVTAQEIKESIDSKKYSHKYIPLTIENWNGVERDTITISATTEKFASKHDNSYADSPLELDFFKFSAFMGIYLSEGSLDKQIRKSDGVEYASEVRIHQNLGTNFDLILDLVYSMGFKKVTVRVRDGIKGDIVIHDTRIADYLMQFGNCYEKYIPEEILSSSTENIKEFLDWFHLGDGTNSKQKDGDYQQSTVFTTSEKLANGLIECILKIGNSTTKRIQLSGQDYWFADHIIECENKSPLYRMTVGKSKGKYIDPRFLSISEKQHDDYVYCLVTETSNFYVEQHGTCFLTGNCRLNVDPAEACHLITELRWEGSDVIGKARVLEGTPKGAILKGLIEGGVCMGVSSRAAGSVKKNSKGINEVQKDLRLSTVDAVSDPSAPDAFVQGLMEGVSWIYENGVFIQDGGNQIEEAVNSVKKASLSQLEEVKLKVFTDFLRNIK